MTNFASTGNLGTTLEALLFRVLWRLEEQGIPFCFLRNSDDLAQRLASGSDVDLIIPEQITADDIFRMFEGFDIVHVVAHPSPLIVYVNAGHALLRIDFIYRNLGWLGAPYLGVPEVLEQRQSMDNLPIAAPVHQAFDVWMSNLLWNGKVKPRYLPLIYQVAQQDSTSLAMLLERAFGHSLGRTLIELAVNGRIEESVKYVAPCRRALWRESLKRNPSSTFRGMFRYVFSRIRFRVRPPGMTVVLLGVDGSGKSSVANELKKLRYPSMPFSGVSVEHLRRPFLPLLADLRRGKLRSNSDQHVTVDPHGKTPHPPLVAGLSMLYLLLDQWLSYVRWARHDVARNSLRVVDRHIIELSVDPLRYRFRGPRWLASIVGRLSPQPALFVLLDAPTSIVRSRKQEVSEAETERQRTAYRSLVLGKANGCIVNADQPLENVVRDVREVIIRHLNERTLKMMQAAKAGR